MLSSPRDKLGDALTQPLFSILYQSLLVLELGENRDRADLGKNRYEDYAIRYQE